MFTKLRRTSSRLLLALCSAIALATSASAQQVIIKPYVQHGDEGPLGATDSKVIAWAVESDPPTVSTAEFRTTADGPWQTATVTGTQLVARKDNPPRPKDPTKPFEDPPHDYRWTLQRADLKNLPLATRISYRIKQNDKIIGEGEFSTRKNREGSLDFIVVGDNAKGTAEQRQIAFAMAGAKPEFIVSTGDMVYNNGRISEYLKNFWPVYVNDDRSDPKIGSPILRNAIFYPCIGNHDIGATDLNNTPDALAAFYFFHIPANTLQLKNTLKVRGGDARLERFKLAAGNRFPAMLNYSWDNGPAHFLMLDANKYVNINEQALRDFVEADLAAAKDAKWKFVFYHQPAFSYAKKHFEEQRMRGLAPLFEKHKVDVVFAGHVHNYQRTRPLTYAPKLDAKNNVAVSKDGQITGTLTVDKSFDGVTDTTPEGIIYIVTGAGGASLHSKDSVGDSDDHDQPKNATTEPAAATAPDTKPAKPKPGPKITQAAVEEAQEFMVKYVGDRHSFTRVQLTPNSCTIQQLDAKSQTLDEIKITK